MWGDERRWCEAPGQRTEGAARKWHTGSMTWFEPDDDAWTYVSRSLIPARLIVLWICLIIPTAVLATLSALDVMGSRLPLGITVVATLVVGAWASWVVIRQVSAHAWSEREEDLAIKRGRLWRSVSVVPYGRMQYVEVNAGPLARAFGIATVQLHTASPGTDASISGVPEAEAARLRDRLTSRGEARLAGL